MFHFFLHKRRQKHSQLSKKKKKERKKEKYSALEKTAYFLIALSHALTGLVCESVMTHTTPASCLKPDITIVGILRTRRLNVYNGFCCCKHIFLVTDFFLFVVEIFFYCCRQFLLLQPHSYYCST